jgi:hypothetical protein
MAIFLGIPAWSDAVHFWLDTAKTTPGWFSTAAPIITNQYFPAALAIFGVIYLVIVGYEGTNPIRHKIVPVVGWVVVGICFVSIFVTAGYGAVEIYIRTEIARGIAGIPRNSSPAGSTPSRPLAFGNHELVPDQIRILSDELPKLRDILQNNMYFAIAPRGSGPLATNFAPYNMIFMRSGIKAYMQELPPRGPQDDGLIIFVGDTNNIPESAQKFIQTLSVADIHPEIMSRVDVPTIVSGQKWMFYIGPAPMD